MEKDLSKSLDLHPPLNSNTPTYHGQLTKQIIGRAIEVHRRLGPGFLESIYEEAFSLKLNKHGIIHGRQRPIRILYDFAEGKTVSDGFIGLSIN